MDGEFCSWSYRFSCKVEASDSNLLGPVSSPIRWGHGTSLVFPLALKFYAQKDVFGPVGKDVESWAGGLSVSMAVSQRHSP